MDNYVSVQVEIGGYATQDQITAISDAIEEEGGQIDLSEYDSPDVGVLTALQGDGPAQLEYIGQRGLPLVIAVEHARWGEVDDLRGALLDSGLSYRISWGDGGDIEGGCAVYLQWGDAPGATYQIGNGDDDRGEVLKASREGGLVDLLHRFAIVAAAETGHFPRFGLNYKPGEREPHSPALPPVEPETGTYVVLSTSHISEATAQFITEDVERALTSEMSARLPFPVWNGPFGFWISAATMERCSHRDLDAARDYARSKGATYLLLDRDAPAVDDLPTFDW